MLCENCNQELNENDKFCGNCGMEVKKTPSFKSEEILKAETFSNSMEKIIPNNQSLSVNYDIEKVKNKKRNRRKIILAIVLVLFVSVIAFVLINNKDLFYSKKGKRTIMIYMIGSDLETKYLAATKDIDEIIDSSINYDDINILLYTGGAKKWHNDEISNDVHTLFEINSEGLNKIEELDNGSMLNSDNLLYLLNYGYDNYNTEYYDLILWDHGAGPIYGYGYDEYNKQESMSIENIKKALSDSSFGGDNKLEIIGFDACLMSSVEVASSLSSYANYMVASQEFEPGSGWNYRFLEKVNSSTSTLDFGKSIIDYFEEYYKSKDYVKGISLSLIKLNKIDNVINYTNKLFSKVDGDLSIDFSTISRTRSNSKSYGRIANEEYYYDLIDLNDLLDKMPKKYEDDINNLKASLKDLVVYQKTDLEDTNGISIFFPYENKKEIESNLEKYKELEFSSSYYSFITDFTKKLTGEKISDWNLIYNQIESYGEGNVSILLNDDVINNYSSADYIIFERTSDGLFVPIFNGSDLKINGNIMSTAIEKKALIATDSKGNKMNLTAIETTNGTDYVSYYIPGTITRFNVDTLELDVMGVYLDFIVDSEHPNGYISKVYPIDLNENLTYSKVEIDLNEWDELSLLSYKYNILNPDGSYTSNWQNSGEVTTISFAKGEEVKIEFNDLDIAKDHYCLFRIKDSQNNTYLSNIVKVNKK